MDGKIAVGTGVILGEGVIVIVGVMVGVVEGVEEGLSLVFDETGVTDGMIVGVGRMNAGAIQPSVMKVTKMIAPIRIYLGLDLLISALMVHLPLDYLVYTHSLNNGVRSQPQSFSASALKASVVEIAHSFCRV
jgi:hypothetical protein